LVGDIQKVSGINRKFNSFATKYCSHQNLLIILFMIATLTRYCVIIVKEMDLLHLLIQNSRTMSVLRIY
jgi:hypothetical protein